MMHLKSLPIIEGQKVVLEPFAEKHITSRYVDWLRNPSIQNRVLGACPSATLEDIREYCHTLMQSKADNFFAIVAKTEECHIGNIRLGPYEEQTGRCRLGMMIGDPAYQGKGIGTEVVGLCIPFCFNELGANTIHLEVLDHNKPAIRVYEKNGFVTKSICKAYVKKNETPYDMRFMEITK